MTKIRMPEIEKMSRRVFVIGVAASACTSNTQKIAVTNPTDTMGGIVQDISAEGLSYMNEYRALSGVKPLKRSTNCAAAAMHQALSMAMSDTLAHNVPDPRGLGQVVERLKYYKVPLPHGENLNYGYRTVRRSVDAWYGSQYHRETLMNPNYRFAAMATATHPDSNNKVWYCGVYSA